MLDRARGQDTLTYFEFATLAALYIFKVQGLNFIVLEVGLGGRLDAVNIVDHDISVITSIGIDHERWLGNDRESIGREKAGILRQNKPFICVDVDPPESVRNEATRLSCPSYYAGKHIAYSEVGSTLALSCLDRSGDVLTINLPQFLLPAPSLLAAAQVFVLFSERTSVARLGSILSEVSLEGRFQLLTLAEQSCVLDVAHNPQAAELLAKTLESHRLKDLVIIFTAMQDKDISGIVAALSGLVRTWICTEIPDLPRASKASDLCSLLHGLGEHALPSGSPQEAFDIACKENNNAKKPIVIMGSFYLVAEFAQQSISVEKAHE